MLMLAFAAAPEGDQACATCHQQEHSHYSKTPMSRALVPVASCEILKRNPDLAAIEGAYTSRIVRDGDRSILTVTDGKEHIAVPLLWAFGRGQAGQTYVFERNGSYYESRMSFYNAIQKLDLTMGAQGTKPANLEEASGRRMESTDARDCFGCHSQGAVANPTPGVGCTSCHKGADKHMVEIKSGNAAAAKIPRLANMPAEDMSELCGSCHRTWSHIAANGPRGINNVRFQPYRLTNSKCYDATDPRISCTACHDPHGPVDTVASHYDAKCTACHAATNAGAKVCRVAKQDCSSCHMPKLELPGAHAKFTDHQIRVYRAGAPYPN